MYRWQMVLVLGSLIFAASGTASEQLPRISGVKDVDTSDRVTAPVVYEDLMLILTSDQGVAAIVFTDKLKEGRAYKYRYESKDAKTKESGDGKVFEKYKRVPRDKPNEFTVVDEGSELILKAGSFKLEWSYAGDTRCWLYYNPDKVRVQIAHAEDFDKVELKRFAK